MKRIISLLIAALLIALMIPWTFAADYGYVYDGTDQMDPGAMTLLSQTMQSIDDNYGVKVRAEIVTEIDQATLYDHCDQVFNQFGDENSILLTVQFADAGGDLSFVDYAWRRGGFWATDLDVSPQMDILSSWFNQDAFSQDINVDRTVCVDGLNFYVGAIGSLLDIQGVGAEDDALILSPDGTPSQGYDDIDNPPIDILPLQPSDSAPTQNNGSYIIDNAGLLTGEQRARLEDLSAQITAEYPINVYVVTVDDFRSINASGVFEAAEQYYLAHGLGYGADRDGMLLMLSMDDRDYSLIAYGDYALTNLTDYGRRKISEQFLDDFRDDDWAGGFTDYLTVTKDYLREAKENRPVDIYPKEPADPKKVRGLGAVISLILGFPASLLACAGMKSKMRSVSAAHSANRYLNANSVRFSDRSEVFTHTTQVRTPIPKPTPRTGGGGSSFGGGGSHINSSGFGGHSGKF